MNAMRPSRLLRLFCTASPKNYSNTFKLRSRLAEFFKHVHPDQMAQAPTKIKEENMRSLKNFNSYVDSLNAQKPVEGKLLKFYISEKTNNKSRKFYSFDIELPEISPERSLMNEERAGKLIDDIVNALNSKFKESRTVQDRRENRKPVSIADDLKVETEEEKIHRMQESISPFRKRERHQLQQEMQDLEKTISSKYMQSEKEALKDVLRKKMAFADTPNNKPMMWGRILMEEAGVYEHYQKILDNLIDPKLIYFDEALEDRHIQQFKEKLLPGEGSRAKARDTDAILWVCEQMEGEAPPLCFYVSRHYSGKDIPGFFTVPYFFKALEMKQKFTELKLVIVEEKLRYEQLYEYYKQIQQELLSSNGFRVEMEHFRNISHINEVILMMQRFTKYSASSLLQGKKSLDLVVLEKDELKILCREYGLDQESTVHLYKGKLYSISYFLDQHLLRALRLEKAEEPPRSQQVY